MTDILRDFGIFDGYFRQAYAAAITKGGSRPAAFVTQANYGNADGDAYAPYRCPTDNMALGDGTPIICSSGTPKLFYCELATPRTPPDTSGHSMGFRC